MADFEWEGALWGEGEWREDEWGEVRYLTGQLRLRWTPSPIPDADYYTIKYSPDYETPWELCEEVHRTTSYLLNQKEEHECVIENRYGKYLIACTDTSGNLGPAGEYVHDTDLAGGWTLLKNIEGHPDWWGEYSNMARVSNPSYLQLYRNAPFVNGYRRGIFAYAENVDIYERQQIRIVSDLLFSQGSDADIVMHEWRNPEGGNNSWKVFEDTTVDVVGTVYFRATIANPTTDVDSLLKQTRILVYFQKAEVTE